MGKYPKIEPWHKLDEETCLTIKLSVTPGSQVSLPCFQEKNRVPKVNTRRNPFQTRNNFSRPKPPRKVQFGFRFTGRSQSSKSCRNVDKVNTVFRYEAS